MSVGKTKKPYVQTLNLFTGRRQKRLLCRSWADLSTFFEYPDEIRKVIYTTNAIESLNSVIRKAIKKRKIFLHDQSALKVIYLAIESALAKWTMPIHNWRQALNHFMIKYPEKLTEY